MLSPDMINTIATLLATEAHIEWLDNYRKSNGNTQCIKELENVEFDINVEWKSLHSLWKEEQKKIFIEYLKVFNKDYEVDEYASIIRDIWLRFNDWCDSSLKVPFDELDEIEKEKDRVVARKIHQCILFVALFDKPSS